MHFDHVWWVLCVYTVCVIMWASDDTYCHVVFFPVMLQPSTDLSSVDKSKHKFMVQSMFAPPDFTPDNLDQLVCGLAHKQMYMYIVYIVPKESGIYIQWCVFI